jgi:hypothetical protein
MHPSTQAASLHAHPDRQAGYVVQADWKALICDAQVCWHDVQVEGSKPAAVPASPVHLPVTGAAGQRDAQSDATQLSTLEVAFAQSPWRGAHACWQPVSPAAQAQKQP